MNPETLEQLDRYGITRILEKRIAKLEEELIPLREMGQKALKELKKEDPEHFGEIDNINEVWTTTDKQRKEHNEEI